MFQDPIPIRFGRKAKPDAGAPRAGARLGEICCAPFAGNPRKMS